MKTIVIVGASHGAVEAAAALRKSGWDDRIVIIGDEPYLPYQRPPLSKAYYQGDMDDNQLLLKSQSFYEQEKIELKLGCRVSAINRDQKRVDLDNGGESIHYDKLILATGTRARPLPNVDPCFTNVHYLRTKGDVEQLKPSHVSGSKLLIIGAGYIGLEIAASAIKKGLQVTILESMDRVLARVTSPVISDFYQALHRQHGIDLRLNTSLKSLAWEEGVTHAVLDDGEQICFDAAIVGIGVLPNVELAEDAGLACDNGILVDEYACTEDSDIYAIGDCSNHPNFLYNRRIRLESVPNAVDQAKIAAANICGESKVYDSIPWFWSDQYNIKLQTAGLLQGYDQVVTRGDTGGEKFSVFYLQQGRLIAMDAINSPVDFMMSKKLISSNVHPDPQLLADSDVAIKTLLI